MCGYALLIVSHSAMCRKNSLHTFALGFCISRKDGTSSKWKQSEVWLTYTQLTRASSVPVQATLSRWIGPVPEGGEWGHLQGAVHMVAARLGCEGPLLWPCGPPLALIAWTGLENTTLTFHGVGFWQGRLLGLWAGVWQPIMLTILSEHGQSLQSAY